MQTSRAGNFASLPYMRPVDGALFARAKESARRGDYASSVELLVRAIATPGTSGGVTLGEALVLLAWAYLRQFKQAECRQILDRAVHGEGMPAADPELCLIGLWLDYFAGKYALVAETTRGYLRAHPYDLDRIYASYLLLAGNAKEKLGIVVESIEDREGSFAIFRLLDEQELVVETSNQLGRVYNVLGDYHEALKWYRRCLKYGLANDNEWQIGFTKLNIGVAFYKLGQYDDATANLDEAITYLQNSTLGFARLDLCRARIALGNVHRLKRDFGDARQALTRAYTMATELRVPREECLALEFLGDVYRDEDQPAEARRYYARGLAIGESIAPAGDLVAELLRRDGECLALTGHVDEALPVLGRSRSLARKLGDRFEEGVALRCLAEAMTASDDFDRAQEYVDASIQMLQEIAARHELAIAHLTAADVYFARAVRPPDGAQRSAGAAGALPVLDDAWHHAVTAQHLCQELGVPYWLNKAQKSLGAVARRRVEELKKLQTAAAADHELERPIVSSSQAMAEVLHLVDAFAAYDEPILITGPTGTGKELVARRIHTHSLRRDRQFVAVNVAAIPATMFEREFFGHVKGAFSGAESDQPGFAIQANGGTLFLDEIGDMPIETQVKLLRLLQDGSYKCLGDPDERRTDVRLIAATNARLLDKVKDGSFRVDLYYRLRILEIYVPPLSERPEDIVPLLEHFLSESAGYGVKVRDYFNATSVRALHEYPWLGNVREVATVARRAYITMEADRRVNIEIGFPPHQLNLTGPGEMDSTAVEAQAGGSDVLTRSRLLLVLEETDGNRAEAARRLGISRATLYRKLNRFGI